MSEYRIRLDNGDILVLSLSVEEGSASATAPVDPASIGSALLAALGIGGSAPTAGDRPVKGSKARKQTMVDDESAENWLDRTSKQSLKGL